MEQDYRLAEGEYRFACLVWANEPLGSGQLVALANEALGWKKSTTYTVLKKLCERGILHNANGTVTALVKQAQVQQEESAAVVQKSFGGSLPRFVAAFLNTSSISEEEAAAIRAMLDDAPPPRQRRLNAACLLLNGKEKRHDVQHPFFCAVCRWHQYVRRPAGAALPTVVRAAAQAAGTQQTAVPALAGGRLRFLLPGGIPVSIRQPGSAAPIQQAGAVVQALTVPAGTPGAGFAGCGRQCHPARQHL